MFSQVVALASFWRGQTNGAFQVDFVAKVAGFQPLHPEVEAVDKAPGIIIPCLYVVVSYLYRLSAAAEAPSSVAEATAAAAELLDADGDTPGAGTGLASAADLQADKDADIQVRGLRVARSCQYGVVCRATPYYC